MGNWYRVTKRINGHLYDYWQRTYRVGESVKTENRYIGPVRAQLNAPADRNVTAVSAIPSPATSCNSGIPFARSSAAVSATAPHTPEEAVYQITPSTAHLTGKDRRDYEKHYEKIRREDERIQYGNLEARVARQEAAVRAAKRKTRGIKAINPFVAKLLVKKT